MNDQIKDSFALDVVAVQLVPGMRMVSDTKILRPEDAIRLVGEQLRFADREMVYVINLKTNGTPINCSLISIGFLNKAILHPRELLKSSFLSNAASIIICHNHPSEDLHPSAADIKMTDQMKRVCKLVGIELLDHVIVSAGNSSYFSFRSKGLMKCEDLEYETDYNNLQW